MSCSFPVDVCDLEVTSGPCEAYMEQFAYDRHTGECVKFVYGGCEGNANRFTSIEECKKICPTSKDQGHVTDYPTTGKLIISYLILPVQINEYDAAFKSE